MCQNSLRGCSSYLFLVNFKHKPTDCVLHYQTRDYTLQHMHQIKCVLAYTFVGFVQFSMYQVDLNNLVVIHVL